MTMFHVFQVSSVWWSNPGEKWIVYGWVVLFLSRARPIYSDWHDVFCVELGLRTVIIHSLVLNWIHFYIPSVYLVVLAIWDVCSRSMKAWCHIPCKHFPDKPKTQILGTSPYDQHHQLYFHRWSELCNLGWMNSFHLLLRCFLWWARSQK